MQDTEACIEAVREVEHVASCIGADIAGAEKTCIAGRNAVNIYLHTLGPEAAAAAKVGEVIAIGVHIAVYKPGRRGLHTLPSLGLLNFIKEPKAYARLNRRSAILFTYGRDALPEGILGLRRPRPGCPDIVVVLDEHGEPIGWGRLRLRKGKPIIENLLDVGWYLRSGV